MAGPTAQGLLAAQKQKAQAPQAGLLSGLSLSPVGPDGMRVPPLLQGILDSAISGATFPGDVYAGRADPTDYGRALDTAGMVTLGAAAFPGNPNDLRMGIKAWNGSRRDFDKFDIEKVGTGTGEKAYGHGLYFATKEDRAKAYKDALSSRGKMYEVILNADPTDFIDADIPIGLQKKVAEKLGIKVADLHGSPDEIIASIQEAMKKEGRKEVTEKEKELLDIVELKLSGRYDPAQFTPRGEEFLPKTADEAKALKEKGIPGATAISGPGVPSRDYIVFDDSIINIVKKYGIIGALSMGAITMQQASQLATEKKRFDEALAAGKGA